MIKLVVFSCSAAIALTLWPLSGASHPHDYRTHTYTIADSRDYKKRYKKRAHKKKTYKKKTYKQANYGFAKHRKGGRIFIFSPRLKAWAAYNSNGVLIASGRASGGSHYCRDVRRACRTPRGYFRVYSKGSSSCRSSKYPLGRGGAPMPHCMFFRGGYAIHGSPDVPRANVSHGCIRVTPRAAAWLHRNFMRIGTPVLVTSY